MNDRTLNKIIAGTFVAVVCVAVVGVVVVGVLLRADHANSKSSSPTPKVKPAEVIPSKHKPDRFVPLPAGDVYAKDAMWTFAIYYLPQATKDPVVTLKKLLGGKYAQFNVLDETTKNKKRPYISYSQPPINDFKPPAPDTYRYCAKGLTDSQKTLLPNSKQAFVIAFTDTPSPNATSLNAATELMLELAEETGGILWDEETREVFSLNEWKSKRLNSWKGGGVPDISRNIVQHLYSTGEFSRIVSLGMRKFGLPDVCVENSARNSSSSMSSLLNVVCQSLAEQTKRPNAGELQIDISSLKNADFRERMIKTYRDKATGKGTLQLALVFRQEGDSNNRLIEITFPGMGNLNEQQVHQEVLGQVFGSEDAISYIKHDDELLAASNKAKIELNKLLTSFNGAIPALEHVSVKAPFKTPKDSNEWMWVEVVKWNDTTIEGVLDNDPFDVPGLKAGARVKVDRASLFDYIHYKADGTTVGNETGKIIQKQNKN